MKNSTWNIKYMVNDEPFEKDNVNLDRFLRMWSQGVIQGLIAKRVKND